VKSKAGFHEQEQLQEKLIALQVQVNDLQEENTILKNKKIFLQTELVKRDRAIEQLSQEKSQT